MPGRRKIRLIEPGSMPGRPFNSWIRRWPLLGPLTLASILQQRGYDVEVYNENISGPLPENAEAYAEVCSADVVGISIMTSSATRGYAIAEAIRRDAPEVTIVFGGVHATFMPQEALAYGDIVVQGEGETVIEDIAKGEITKGVIRAAPLSNLDDVPTINHFLMRDFEKLIVESRRRELYPLPVMTSRGCPYGCIYCSVTRMFGRKVRRQSVAKVHGDMREYADQGFRHFFFYDDNFTTDRCWTRTLLERLRPMDLRFNAQARVDFHWLDRDRTKRDKELLTALRRSGGDVLYVGYETVDESTAKRWRKGYRGESSLEVRLAEDTRVLHESGFWVHGMFILGPEHTGLTADRIVDFSRRNSIESLQISILTPFPGTPLMEQMRPNLVFSDFPADWDYFDGAHCVYNHSKLSIPELQRVLFEAHKRFYRWAGWSLPRVKGFLASKLPFRDKLAMLWSNARTARRTLVEWREETKDFLRLVESKVHSQSP